MTKFAFFSNRAERWKRDLVSLWGNFNVCPCLDHLELPCHSPVELSSVSSLKVWGNTKEPHHDIAYLLVCMGSTNEDRQCGISLVWVNPKQTRASTMEEAVETLATYPSSGTDWPYALTQLYEGSHHAPLPKDKHLGILPQGKAEETSCGQISQLDICQLLSAGPQVVYPSGLNGHDEPIITTLQELLSSGTSIIASKHLYLEIDIPPKEESGTKALPIGKASIIQATNPYKSPPKLEGSMTTEVNHLLDQEITEVSSCESKQSSLEKIITAVVTMSPPWKSEVSVPPVDTSSQASIKEAEGSLEDIPANISPIAAVYSSKSVSPLVDPSELQANANGAIDNMLHLNRSLDIKRQRATWELGVLLHQNESQEATSVAAAKDIFSQAVLEAKTNFWAAVMEAKTTRCHSIQAAKAACSKAISDAEAWKTSQDVIFQEEHGKYMQSLEEQAFGEESRSHHEVLSSCQATLYHSPQLLRGALAASYHILLGQTPPSPPFILPPRTPSKEEQPSTATPPMPMPKQSPRLKRQHPLPELMGNMPMGRATLAVMLGGPPSPKKWETPPWFKLLKPGCAEAFLRDSSIVVEVRLHFFSKHSYNFNQDSNCDLSGILKIGSECQLTRYWYLWNRSIVDRAWRAEASKLHPAVPTPTLESPKVIGLVGIHDPDALWHFAGFTYCPWCGKEGQNEGTVVNHLRTTHYRLGLVCDKCHSCLTTTCDTLCHHGHHNCHQVITPSESVPSD